MSGWVDPGTTAVFYVVPDHWSNQLKLRPPLTEPIRRQGRPWALYAKEAYTQNTGMGGGHEPAGRVPR